MCDIKFPHRIPIIAETHEVQQVYDVRRGKCYEDYDMQQQIQDMQAGLAAAAGYFGGYTSKMQDIGKKELQRLEQGLYQKLETEQRTAQARESDLYSRRLVRDLESKGMKRTALETLNLALHAKHPNVMMAKCIRSFPTVAFPASLLLKREEVETRKVSGHSVIAPIHHGKGVSERMYVEAPMDLMYGFRGNEHNVSVLSPYEMLLHWSIEPVHARLTLHV